MARTHGLSHLPEHKIWDTMVQRCTNPKNKKYRRYGGRGISVCERWRKFENFFDDMGLRPSPKHQIDRVDNDGNYEPDNCRWATAEEQANNRESSHLLSFLGETMTVSDWSKRLGIPAKTIFTRLDRGWSQERALGEKVRVTSQTWRS